MARRIMVLDDDDLFLDLMRELLDLEGFEADAYTDASEAWRNLYRTPPSCLFLDLRLGDRCDGWNLLRLMMAKPVLSPRSIVICTADEAGVRAHAEEVAHYDCQILLKPFDLSTLRTVLRRAAP